jgi:hypothetical protein
LIQQWLEQVKVSTVNERNIDGEFGGGFYRVQACETSADDNDAMSW